jgi:hypothetical protein
VLPVQTVAIRLKCEHELQVTAAEDNDGILEIECRLRERVRETGILPLRVDPEDEAALTDFLRHLGGEDAAGGGHPGDINVEVYRGS